MIAPRRAKDRRHNVTDRQDVSLTFDPEIGIDAVADGFGSLKALSECRFRPGRGSASHRYSEAEVVTYVHQGALAHHDNLGRSGVIHAGEFRRLTAGSGVRRNETNASRTYSAHFFTIQIGPLDAETSPPLSRNALARPSVEGGSASSPRPTVNADSMRLHQDALLYSVMLNSGQHLVHELPPSRSASLQLVQGGVSLDNLVLAAGDGAGVTGERAVLAPALEETELLLLDVAAIRPTPPTTRGARQSGVAPSI